MFQDICKQYFLDQHFPFLLQSMKNIHLSEMFGILYYQVQIKTGCFHFFDCSERKE